MKEVTGLIIIHNDSQMLKPALESVKGFVSKLVVVDGAYEWVAPFCELNSESPTTSQDELIKILEESEIPYEHYTGIWENESHKRLFSIEQCQSEFALLIDSDEVFELDQNKVEDFMSSGKTIAECYFPLYYSPDYIGINPNLNSPTRKSALLNLQFNSPKEIVDSLFLLVPENERVGGITNQQRYKDVIGTIHHLSLFRFGLEAYRRARFYNLLSMRINKKFAIVNTKGFSDDSEFFNLLCDLSNVELKALDNFFKFHKISASFPTIKQNQVLVDSECSEQIKPIISACFSEMLSQHHENLNKYKNESILYFSGKPMIFDVTQRIKESSQFCIRNISSINSITFTVHEDHGAFRKSLPVQKVPGADVLKAKSVSS